MDNVGELAEIIVHMRQWADTFSDRPTARRLVLTWADKIEKFSHQEATRTNHLVHLSEKEVGQYLFDSKEVQSELLMSKGGCFKLGEMLSQRFGTTEISVEEIIKVILNEWTKYERKAVVMDSREEATQLATAIKSALQRR